MRDGNDKCDATSAPAPAPPPPPVGAGRKGKRRRAMAVAVAQRRQTVEEARQYRIAVRALVAELIGQIADAKEKRDG